MKTTCRCCGTIIPLFVPRTTLEEKHPICSGCRYPRTGLECKGAYRFHSQGRALTAFREAVAAFPEFGFVWAVRRGPGDWEITRHA